MALRILLVYDSRFILKAVTAMLEQIGSVEIQTAADGQIALDILRENEFDMVFSDLNMPVMNGLELLRNMAELEVKSAIVLMSSEDKRILATAQQLAKAHDLHILGYLEKPFKVLALRSFIDAYEDQKSAADTFVQEQLSLDEIVHGLKNGALFPVYQPKI